MPDGVERLAAKLAEFERRLRHLETAPQMSNTSVHGGYTRWLPKRPATLPALFIGPGQGDDVGIAMYNTDLAAQWFGAGAFGVGTRVFVANPDQSGQVVDVLDGKLVMPLIACAWQSDHNHAVDSFGRPIITAGSYERVWAAFLPVGTGKITGDIFVSIGAGITSAAVRIRVTLAAGGVSGGTQTVTEQTGITTSGFLTGAPWTIPNSIVSPSASPVGRLVRLELEGRVTGGSGDLAVAPTQPVVNGL